MKTAERVNRLGIENAFETQEYLRFSYATSPETIREGLARIRKALERR